MSYLTTIDKISMSLHQKLYAELDNDQTGSVEEIFFGPILELKAWAARNDFDLSFGYDPTYRM